MEVQTIKGFKFRKVGNIVSDFLIESNKIDRSIKFIKENKIKNVEFNSEWGYKLKKIDFFIEIADIVEEISIVDDDIDLKGIGLMKNLKTIFVGGDNKYPLDFSNFKHLRSCNISWHKNLKNLDQCRKLRELIVRKYINSNEGFQFISDLTHINKLVFIKANFENLELLKQFPHIEALEISYNSHLHDISGIKDCSKTLSKLVFENCKKIENYQDIAKLVNLLYLEIYNCSDIPSLNFLRKNNKLKHLSFVGTKVLDGNLKLCSGIEYVAFNDMKHYSHKWKDFSSFVPIIKS